MAVTKRQNKAKKGREQERVSPRVFRFVALPAPTGRENICDVRTGAFAGLSTARP